MTAELMPDIAVGGAAPGSLSAFYFYACASIQLPAGMLKIVRLSQVHVAPWLRFDHRRSFWGLSIYTIWVMQQVSHFVSV
jgi:hypothetical protein